MNIFCKELNKEFVDKETMFLELVKNQSKIIELKKACIKNSDSTYGFFVDKKAESEKSLSFVKDGFVYPVINTTNFLDSHGDVHFPNIWNKSLKDKSRKIFYVTEHNLNLESVIAFPEDVNAFVKTLTWKDLGFDLEGSTQALIYEINKSKIRIEKIKELFDQKIAFENSVKMRYITMNLALDSKNPEFSKSKTLWDERIDLIVNKDKANEMGYFWAIDEASIEKEGCLCLFGSNSATPILYEAVYSDTSNKKEPSINDTQATKRVFIN
ncbi:MAG: hypothetical protein LH615_04070 [Ferruginibacter sp.]|nr:hypothetical protein [Ferruginibacter sp.]